MSECRFFSLGLHVVPSVAVALIYSASGGLLGQALAYKAPRLHLR